MAEVTVPESNVGGNFKLQLNEIQPDGEGLVFEAEDPISWEFGRFADYDRGEIGIPASCANSDENAALEMVGEITVPFNDTYTKNDMGAPGRWDLLASKCVRQQDEPNIDTMWWAGMESILHQEDPPTSLLDKSDLNPDQLVLSVIVDQWDENGKKVWNRVVIHPNPEGPDSRLTEETSFEFVFLSDS